MGENIEFVSSLPAISSPSFSDQGKQGETTWHLTAACLKRVVEGSQFGKMNKVRNFTRSING